MLRYGGNDITRFFYWLLQRVSYNLPPFYIMYFSFLQANFPYKTCSVESIMDGNLIAKLKERYCHFDMVLLSVNTSYNPIVVRPFGVWLKRK